MRNDGFGAEVDVLDIKSLNQKQTVGKVFHNPPTAAAVSATILALYSVVSPES